jgi:hypothetical protein
LPQEPYFPSKPVKLDYIYFHVGRVLVNWASAEDSIDLCLAMFAKALPDPLYQKPASTKRRIATFKKQVRQLKITDAQLLTARRLILRFNWLAKERHWLAHGIETEASFIGATWRKQGGWIEYRRSNRKTNAIDWRQYHLCHLEEMGDEALHLASDIMDWLTVDLGCATPKKTEKVARKIGRRLP